MNDKAIFILSLSLILLGYFDKLITNLICLSVPVIKAQYAQGKNRPEETRLILIYFIAFFIFLTLEFLLSFAMHLFPFWHFLKLLIFSSMLFPKLNGLKILYGKVAFKLLAMNTDDNSIKHQLEKYFKDYDKKYSSIPSIDRGPSPDRKDSREFYKRLQIDDAQEAKDVTISSTIRQNTQ